MKRILLVLAVMLCSAQMVFAYSFSNSRVQATVTAAGQVIDLSVDGMPDAVDVIEAAIGWEGGGGNWISGFYQASVDDSTANFVSAVYLKDNVKVAGDKLIVRVSTKLVGQNPYLDQRYEVVYWENPGGTGPSLNNVKIYLLTNGNGGTNMATLMQAIGTPPDNSSWLWTSIWPNPVDTAIVGNLRSCAYVPGTIDDNQYGSDGAMRVAIESGILNPASSVLVFGGSVAQSWSMGNLDTSVNPNKALDVRATVVPEPCTMALMGAGLLGLFGVRRRRA